MRLSRLGYELSIAVVLILLAVGIWIYQGHRAESEIEAVHVACAAHTAALTAGGESWAGALASGQAEVAFRAFAAGVHPLILGGENDALDQSVGALLRLPGVTFVHLLAADGTVLASSDRKLTTTGNAGEAGAWALAADDLVSRAGEAAGSVELAAPIVGAAGPAGYLWMGYAVERARDEARPESWPAAEPAAAHREPAG